MSRAERERELRANTRRLTAALSAIHDALHANEVDRAHELCECALSGDVVSQPNLSVADAAKGMSFAADFNRLAERSGVKACCIVALPSMTVDGAVSLQLMGEVEICKVVEKALRGAESAYVGDHADH